MINIGKVYNDMTDYQKKFITEAQVKSLTEYEAKLSDLLKAEEAAGGSKGDDSNGDDDGKS